MILLPWNAKENLKRSKRGRYKAGSKLSTLQREAVKKARKLGRTPK